MGMSRLYGSPWILCLASLAWSSYVGATWIELTMLPCASKMGCSTKERRTCRAFLKLRQGESTSTSSVGTWSQATAWCSISGFCIRHRQWPKEAHDGGLFQRG